MSLFGYSTVALATLLIQETKEAIYRTALDVAVAVGLPVSSWQDGDPTRSLYLLEAELLAKLEEVVVGYIRAGFLDYAAELALSPVAATAEAGRAWLTILAKQQFNVDVPTATYASGAETLTNSGGGYYPDIAAGDLTFKCSISGRTYTNTSGGTLASGPGTTLDVDIAANDSGSGSSAGAGEIDEMVTTLLGVTCSNDAALIGTDEQDPSTTVQQCRDKLGSLSPNGPREAYSYVARNPKLTGTAAVTRVRAYPGAGDTGDVTIYLATGSGGVTEADRALVETAILKWATPICVTPTVLAAVNVTVNVTYEVWIYKSCNKTADEVKADILAALEAMFADRPIGGDIVTGASTGKLYRTLIESTIRAVFPQCFRVSVTAPSGDTSLTNAQVAALGTVTGTVNLVVDA